MHYISHFINYIVRHDLRRCVNNTQDNVYTYTYKAIHDELYMLTSRLALNWDKTDDYIQASLFSSSFIMFNQVLFRLSNSGVNGPHLGN